MNTGFNPYIRVIEEAYEMPQLGRKRRISALLPYDYDLSNKHYPVLYLHDGQNLFNEHAPYGNWAIDQSLAGLKRDGFKDIIVIAIDHGEKDRISEYSPFKSERYGEGQGILYLRFLLETLKPYVDSTFRVLTDGQNTGIGGSSMGGLISLFAGMAQPTVFSKMMVFSPSLWIAPKIFKLANKFQPNQSRMYLYAGAQESQQHVPNIVRLNNILLEKDYPTEKLAVKLVVNPEGTHSEHFWKTEFPIALKWLYE